jgi:hypothetical protein
MAYTPELSLKGSSTLRRLAWYMGKPMTTTLEVVVELAAKTIDQKRPGCICEACRDKTRCGACCFGSQPP